MGEHECHYCRDTDVSLDLGGFWFCSSYCITMWDSYCDAEEGAELDDE